MSPCFACTAPLALLAQTLAALTALTALTAQAAPYVPASDAEVVQKLPARLDATARSQRAELSRQPQNLALALATAQAAITRSRQLGDPRELGLAQAALAPWWSLASPPSTVRLLRGIVLQSQHQFDAALADLGALARDDAATPLAVQAQAGLSLASVLQVLGRLDEARAACEGLLAARFAPQGSALSLPARACLSELRSLQGQGERATRELAALAREAPDNRWLALLRAELAERRGEHSAAQALYRQASATGSDVYAVAAFADWWLDQGQPARALALVKDGESDALMLRRAIAMKRLNDPQAAGVAADLQSRFDAARLRGEAFHAREEARLALDVQGQSARALRLAQANWAHQKEPADAVLLARAAVAAGQPDIARGLWPGQRRGDAVDVRLTQALKPRQP